MSEAQWWRISGVKVGLEAQGQRAIQRAAAKALKCSADAILDVNVVRRAFDARGRKPLVVYSLELKLDPEFSIGREDLLRKIPESYQPVPTQLSHRPRVAIIGAGPAGLFAALRLSLEGLNPVIFERGKAVLERHRDVDRLFSEGQLKPDSNVAFGEGGAGTYSDGKLVTRLNAPQIDWVLHTMVSFGAPKRILTDSKPHIGTDKLGPLMEDLRAHLLDLGVQYQFGARVDRPLVRDGRVAGVVVDGQQLEFDAVLMATGHSARDLYHELHALGVAMQPKALAMGFRVEHPQALINSIQYGKFHDHPMVPVADYRLSTKVGGEEDRRGVYSFCMCPGGEVVNASTEAERLVVNGMSNSQRDGGKANAAVVVTLSPADYVSYDDSPLAAIEMQRQIESKAFQLGGGDFVAPAQRLEDFLAGRQSTSLPNSTYLRGLNPQDLTSLYPEPITTALSRGLRNFDKKMRGFVSNEALLIGAETRTSAPVRVLRDEHCQSVSHPGLYPTGEGAGYAGGIMSSALDGLRVAEALLQASES